MQKHELLEQLGLSEKQAKVYLALLELGESTIGPIASRSGVKRTSIYNFIRELVALGLLTQTERHNRASYRAEPPQKLKQLIDSRQKQLTELLPELETLYQAAGVTPTRVSYYRNPSELKILLFEPLHDRVKTIDYLWARDLMKKVFGQTLLDDYKKRREAAKIFVRIIHPRTVTTNPIDRREDQRRFRERRFAPAHLAYQASVTIFGNKVAFISSRKENFGVLIESAEFSQACRVLYEGLWSIAETK